MLLFQLIFLNITLYPETPRYGTTQKDYISLLIHTIVIYSIEYILYIRCVVYTTLQNKLINNI